MSSQTSNIGSSVAQQVVATKKQAELGCIAGNAYIDADPDKGLIRIKLLPTQPDILGDLTEQFVNLLTVVLLSIQLNVKHYTNLDS